MRKLLDKFIRFVLVSGVGWLLDFGIFWVLTGPVGLPILWANYLSSACSVSFVFVVSTKKILANNKKGMPLWGKYALYVAYQLVLVTVVSLVAQALNGWLLTLAFIRQTPLLFDHTELLAKICITPITMICNFLVLRYLVEEK